MGVYNVMLGSLSNRTDGNFGYTMIPELNGRAGARRCPAKASSRACMCDPEHVHFARNREPIS